MSTTKAQKSTNGAVRAAHRGRGAEVAMSENGNLASSVAQEEIAALAHHLWEVRGCPIGSPEEDWFLAETELAKASVLTR